jgi:hypothetical protein
VTNLVKYTNNAIPMWLSGNVAYGMALAPEIETDSTALEGGYAPISL